MNAMLSYCGLNCESCPIHLATLERDAVKRKNMRIEIARMCREQYGKNLDIQDVTDCDGCRARTGRLFSGCANCAMRKCAIERNVTSCAFCADFACETLLKHFASDPSARARLEAMRPAP